MNWSALWDDALTAASALFAEAFRVLHSDPKRSEQLCRAMLSEGEDPGAALMLAAARRLQDDPAGARAHAQAVARTHPNWAGAQFELGMALGRMGRHAEALDALRAAERLAALPGLWRELGDQLFAIGDIAAADQAYLRHVSAPTFEPLLHEALAARQRGDAASAERALHQQLKYYPNDVLGLRHLAEIFSAQDRYDEAATLLQQCLHRSPSFALARFGLAMVLFHSHQLSSALEQIEVLLKREPKRLEYLNLKADALGRIGDFEAAAACSEFIISAYPTESTAWLGYGHALRSLGRRDACEAAYKRAVELGGNIGEAFWGLANLKTYRFAPDDVASMREHAEQSPPGEDRTSLLFALGKAHEDMGEIALAFAAYIEANASRRARFPYDRQEREDAVARARAVFTSDFFSAHIDEGCAAADPIFILGMPRSGSTLVEQILASHSVVEGTMELIELVAMARRLGRDGDYPELLRWMPAEELRRLGEEYLARTRVFRRTMKQRFIDKLPNNFTQVGLIHLILPNATIIDVRRHPLACCVSNFRQHWATGQNFAYDLEDLGHYYRFYVEQMAHFDAAAPGRVHRVIYEDLVADAEGEVRRLLTACELPFEEGCLRFFENKRAVRTPSSEQVRMPIFSAGLDNWRPFERWLEPLKQALGPVLEAYPAIPQF